METIISELIEKIEIGDDNSFIKIYFKNGESDKYSAVVRSNMYGVIPVLENIESCKHYQAENNGLEI